MHNANVQFKVYNAENNVNVYYGYQLDTIKNITFQIKMNLMENVIAIYNINILATKFNMILNIEYNSL